jgi:hypothetical protein
VQRISSRPSRTTSPCQRDAARRPHPQTPLPALGRVRDRHVDPLEVPTAALIGGTVAGLVIGAAQSLVSRRRLDPRRWIPATAIGIGLGLLLGASIVGYNTSLADLAMMGALTGIVLGPSQAIALPRHTQLRWAWAVAMPVLWGLGWTATTLGGISVDEQFTVFGAYGALTFSALSGLLLHRLPPYRASTEPRPAQPPVAAPA